MSAFGVHSLIQSATVDDTVDLKKHLPNARYKNKNGRKLSRFMQNRRR